MFTGSKKQKREKAKRFLQQAFEAQTKKKQELETLIDNHYAELPMDFLIKTKEWLSAIDPNLKEFSGQT